MSATRPETYRDRILRLLRAQRWLRTAAVDYAGNANGNNEERLAEAALAFAATARTLRKRGPR